jgi:Pyruvate/2-oxoacid:ferredoxin oxidoreductase gamma subunit
LNNFFGTKKSTVGNKAADIRKMFKMNQMTNFDFMVESRKEKSTAYNMVMVDGFFVHISALPEEYQKIARAAKERGENISFRTK